MLGQAGLGGSLLQGGSVSQGVSAVGELGRGSGREEVGVVVQGRSLHGN